MSLGPPRSLYEVAVDNYFYTGVRPPEPINRKRAYSVRLVTGSGVREVTGYGYGQAQAGADAAARNPHVRVLGARIWLQP